MAGCLACVHLLLQHLDGNLMILWLKVSDSLIVLGSVRGGWTARSRIMFRCLPSFAKTLAHVIMLHNCTLAIVSCKFQWQFSHMLLKVNVHSFFIETHG